MNTLSTRHPSPASATAASIASAQIWVALQFDSAIRLAADAGEALASEGAPVAAAHAWRAAGVVQSLQMTLDMQRGGELARQLFELFDYLQRQLRGASAGEPVRAYREVVDLLSQVRQAWQTEPELVPTYSRHVTPQVH